MSTGMVNGFLTRIIPETLRPYMTDSVIYNLGLFGLGLLVYVFYLVILIFLTSLLRRLNKSFFRYKGSF